MLLCNSKIYFMSKDKVEEYNYDWPKFFQAEKDLISNKLVGIKLQIHHIGSTSVEDLCAKPKIDILLIANDFPQIIKLLEELGYKARGEFNIPFHECMTKRLDSHGFNLHIFTEDHPEIKLNLMFRDFLRQNSEWKNKYGELKRKLSLQEKAFEKDAQGVKSYTLAKNDLIIEILNEAGFNEFSLKYCMHDNEWDEFGKISHLREFTSDIRKEAGDIHHRKKFCFILYEGVKIVAAAIIDNTEIVQVNAVSNEEKYLTKMRELLHKWLRWKGKK